MLESPRKKVASSPELLVFNNFYSHCQLPNLSGEGCPMGTLLGHQSPNMHETKGRSTDSVV